MSRTAWMVPIAVALVACGYQSTRANSSGSSATFCIARAADVVPDARVAAAVEQGVRSALSRAGALGECGHGPTLRVRVVDVAFEPAGVIASTPGGPVDRGVRARVTAYAEVEGTVPSDRATPGLVTEAVTVALSGAGPIGSRTRQDAAAAAGRRVGEAIGRWVLGDPAPTGEATIP